MKKCILRIVFLVIIIVISGIIFGFSAQDGEESGNLSKTVITKIADILNVEENSRENFIETGEVVIRKLAHFTIYSILTYIQLKKEYTNNIYNNLGIFICFNRRTTSNVQ